MGRFLGISIPVAKILRDVGIPIPKKEDGSTVSPSQQVEHLNNLTAGFVKIPVGKIKDLEFNGKISVEALKNVTTLEPKKDKTFVGGLLGDLWGNIKDGVGNGLGNAGQTLIDKLTGKVIGSNGVQGSKDSISDYASGIMESSIAKYIKRNWFYILFPVIGLMVFAKVLYGNKKPRSKRRY